MFQDWRRVRETQGVEGRGHTPRGQAGCLNSFLGPTLTGSGPHPLVQELAGLLSKVTGMAAE